MHGYIPAECPEMRGLCILWRDDGSLAARDLGDVNALEFHPTVARILGIEPAAAARAKPFAIR